MTRTVLVHGDNIVASMSYPTSHRTSRGLSLHEELCSPSAHKNSHSRNTTQPKTTFWPRVGERQYDAEISKKLGWAHRTQDGRVTQSQDFSVGPPLQYEFLWVSIWDYHMPTDFLQLPCVNKVCCHALNLSFSRQSFFPKQIPVSSQVRISIKLWTLKRIPAKTSKGFMVCCWSQHFTIFLIIQTITTKRSES